MGEKCVRKFIYELPQGDRCAFVKKNCLDSVNVVSIVEFYFCDIDEMWYLMALIAFIAIFLLFRLIDHTSDDYLSVSLNKLSKYLKISEALTGVTLLAFANGAPDIVTSMVAGGDAGGTAVSIGGLYGASLFVTNIVFSRCVHVTKKKDLAVVKKFFIRDVGTFWIATTTLIVFSFIGVPIYLVSIFLVSLYIVYGLVVIMQEYLEKRQREKRQTEALLQQQSQRRDSLEFIQEIENFQQPTYLKFQNMKTQVLREKEEDSDDALGEFREEKLDNQAVYKYENLGANFVNRFWKRYSRSIHSTWSQKNLFEKTVFILEYPFQLMMLVTIPSPSKKLFKKKLGVVYPFTSFWFGLFATTISLNANFTVFGVRFYLIFLVVPIQMALSFLIFYSSSNDRPTPRILWTFSSAIMAVLWVYLTANVVMDFLDLVQAVTNLSNVFLGLTLLSLGNSLGDFFVDGALAQRGFEVMAITGIFAGQLLNLLLGFSLNCFMQFLKNKKATFKIYGNESLDTKTQVLCLFVMGYSSLRLLAYILNAIFSNYRFAKFHKYVGVLVYALFIVVFMVFEFAIF